MSSPNIFACLRAVKNSSGIGVSDFAIDNNGISDINEINGINDISVRC